MITPFCIKEIRKYLGSPLLYSDGDEKGNYTENESKFENHFDYL